MITDKDKGNILYIYDPISLINFFKSDLDILHRSKLMVPDEEKEEGLKFTRVVKLCVKKGIHSRNHQLTN